MGGLPRTEVLPNSGEVYVLYVRQTQQGCWHGRRLVQAVANHFAQTGLSGLMIGCLASNTPARRFYEALGGRVVAEREFDHDGVLLPEVVYGWEDLPLLIKGGTSA